MMSFRKRIRWSALSLITLLLLIFCVSVYGSLSLLLYRHTDAQLLASARAQAERVEEETGHLDEHRDKTPQDDGDHPDGVDRDHDEHEFREAIRDSVVLSPDGHVQWKGEHAGFSPGLNHQVRSPVLHGAIMFETLHPPHGPPIRRISFPIASHGAVGYILQTQTSLAMVTETLEWLLIALGVVTIGVMLLGWLGSTWITQVVLAPLDALSHTAANVSAQSLQTRAFLDAPYEEFRQLSQSFNNMLDRLQRVFRSQRRFVADAAHELKTPLTAMKGSLEVALRRARSREEYQEVLASQLHHVEKMVHLSTSLLSLTAFEGERPPVTLSLLALGPLVQDVAGDLGVLVGEKHCTLHTDIQDVPFIQGDAGQLKQLMINLLDNAIRYTEAGGRISVSLNTFEGNVVLVVEDTGQGIAAAHVPHIFDRFYRADEARDRRTGGSGLGLSIVKEIAKAHNGHIDITSELGKGTRCTLSLPTNHKEQ